MSQKKSHHTHITRTHYLTHIMRPCSCSSFSSAELLIAPFSRVITQQWELESLSRLFLVITGFNDNAAFPTFVPSLSSAITLLPLTESTQIFLCDSVCVSSTFHTFRPRAPHARAVLWTHVPKLDLRNFSISHNSLKLILGSQWSNFLVDCIMAWPTDRDQSIFSGHLFFSDFGSLWVNICIQQK